MIGLCLPSSCSVLAVTAVLGERRGARNTLLRRTNSRSEVKVEERRLGEHHERGLAGNGCGYRDFGRRTRGDLSDMSDSLWVGNAHFRNVLRVCVLRVCDVLIVVARDGRNLFVHVRVDLANSKAACDERAANPGGEDGGEVKLGEKDDQRQPGPVPAGV